MSSYKVKKTPGNTEWFMHDRFGMFIHFGLFSMPARNEWIKTLEFIPEDKYQKYFDNFNPDLFDAKEWAKKAKEAGMKYAVLTAKHHEGFCMFDSQYTNYKITNTAFGRDVVREFVDAFRAEGLRVGLYYSLVDWYHPEFPIDVLHPRRNDENAEELDRGRDMKKYAQYMRNQVRELLTNYGQIDILWFDFSYKGKDAAPWRSKEYRPWMQHNGGKEQNEWEAEELLKMVRELQPEVIINNRTRIDQDIWTPEQYQPLDWVKDKTTGELVPWEACQTFSGSWGYFRDEMTWKSPKMLIDLLINTVSVGGNLIMNVGPTARGYFDYRANEALSVYAEWMKYNSRSIYGCTMAEPEFTAPRGARLTQSLDGKKLYVHIMEYPHAFLEMNNMAGKIEYAQFLHDGSEVIYYENAFTTDQDTKETAGMVAFAIPAVQPNVIDPVIEVILK
ncbi:MAG: alpha-L-fucosidase [Clostridia bacterium]|nr:alpha-L-fucosidase [Clostridia bacterium]